MTAWHLVQCNSGHRRGDTMTCVQQYKDSLTNIHSNSNHSNKVWIFTKKRTNNSQCYFQQAFSPQPAETILSVSAQIPLTLQTLSLLLPLSALGAQVPERDKEYCMIYPEVRNVGCPRGWIFSNTTSFTPKDYGIKTKS